MIGRLKNESGFALILTLVVTSLMVAIVVEMIHQVYVDTSLSRGFRDGQQASILAESGATGVKTLLSSNAANNTIISRLLATPIKLEDEIGSLVVTTSDESAKININGLVRQNLTNEPNTLATLKRLGIRLKLPENYWDAVTDWIVKNDSPRYRLLSLPYSDNNRKLKTLSELSLIKGKDNKFTPEIVDRLRPYVTIFPAAANTRININTATKEVLATLEGIDDGMAEQIVAERRLRRFENVGELSRVRMDGQIIASLTSQVDVTSTLFRITSVARVKESVKVIEAVVSNGLFLSWQEY